MAKKKSERKASGRWTVQEAKDLLDEIEAQGVSDLEFTQRHGLKVGRIAWWRKQLGRQRRAGYRAKRKPLTKRSGQAAAFVEIKTAREMSAEARIEVRLRNGRSVLLPVGAPTANLGLLLDVVEDTPC